jgi:hypothetical protein
MSISVYIRNEEPAGSAAVVSLTVVTVGNVEAGDEKHRLVAQQAMTLQVHRGQFVMVDETDKEGG